MSMVVKKEQEGTSGGAESELLCSRGSTAEMS